MKDISLKLKQSPVTLPLDLRQITPENLSDKALDQIEKIPIWIGNKKSTLDQIFEINIDTQSNSEDQTIIIEGDIPSSKRIGYKMKSGKIIVNGQAGFYVGSEMNGGHIRVNGDVGEWAGIGMKNGLIEIEGDAGNFLGSAYRGTRKGMKGGLIIVKGDAGCEAGGWMRGGAIKILGNAHILPGIHMTGGSILIGKNCPSRVGASMTGGKVVVQGKTNEILSGFQIEEIKGKVKVEGEKIAGPFYSFSGDNAEGGKGKLLMNKENNPHLSIYDEYL
jgi:formylmethanofuran dehydrogenase subunit C